MKGMCSLWRRKSLGGWYLLIREAEKYEIELQVDDLQSRGVKAMDLLMIDVGVDPNKQEDEEGLL